MSNIAKITLAIGLLLLLQLAIAVLLAPGGYEKPSLL